MDDQAWSIASIMGVMLACLGTGDVPASMGVVHEGEAAFNETELARVAAEASGRPVNVEDVEKVLGPDGLGFEPLTSMPGFFMAPTLEEARRRWDQRFEQMQWPERQRGWSGGNPLDLIPRERPRLH